MKKLLLLLMVMFSFWFAKANPIIPPPVISEFYLVDNSTWYLELDFTLPIYYWVQNLDGFTIESSFGTVQFKNGITVPHDSILIITQDSMQSPLSFDRTGDYISISGTYVSDGIRFGNVPNSRISAPFTGQSIVNMKHLCSGPYSNAEYLVVKDNNPTIGSNPFQPCSPTSIFTGHVYDAAHNPVSGIYIGNHLTYNYPPFCGQCSVYFNTVHTNSSGTFSYDEYCVKYFVELFFQPNHILMTSVVNIEPDSINYYEFTLDTLLTGIQSANYTPNFNFSCFPNPSKGETYIKFTNPGHSQFTKALIKIYDPIGEIVRIIPLNFDTGREEYLVKWDGLCYNHLAASGIYYCKLELDGQKVATDKIIIVR